MVFIQKIIKIGNSYGVVIPRALVNYLGWKPGMSVDVRYSPQRKTIVIKDKTGRGLNITKKKAKKEEKSILT